MIEIRKHGKLVDRRYLTGCRKCGCEFWFDRADYIGKNGEKVTISCPECKHIWSGQRMGNIAWTAELLKEETK